MNDRLGIKKINPHYRRVVDVNLKVGGINKQIRLTMALKLTLTTVLYLLLFAKLIIANPANNNSSHYNAVKRNGKPVNCLLELVPNQCYCYGLGIFCNNNNLKQIPPLPERIITLDLSKNNLTMIGNSSLGRQKWQIKSLIITKNEIKMIELNVLANLPQLTNFHMSDNRITELNNYIFKRNRKLRLLNLSYNPITKIGPHTFAGLTDLIELDLRECKLTELPPKAFSALINLGLLWLQNNQIKTINPDSFAKLNLLDTLSLAYNQLDNLDENTFSDLINVKSLDLQGNYFSKLPPDVFTKLKKLNYIYFSQFHLCTYALQARVCAPRGDGISSVQHLLDNAILRIAVWIVAIIAIFGNCLVIIGRMMMREINLVHSFFIKHLAMADLLMGFYLLIIAYYDIKFRDHYILHEEDWRVSWQCTFAGVISSVSSEASVFILAIITIDRYLSIMYPFIIKPNSMQFAIWAMFTVWIGSLVLALLPILAKEMFIHQFYGNNGVCLGLQIHQANGFDYSTFLFCCINSIVFVFILFAYVKMSTAIMQSTIGLRSSQQHDTNIAKRCAFIVITDGVCWLPIIIIKLVALCGLHINQELYAWVAVFLLPANSALNPILYTLSTKLFKQHIKIIANNFLSSAIRHNLAITVDQSGSFSLLNGQQRRRNQNFNFNPEPINNSNGNEQQNINGIVSTSNMESNFEPEQNIDSSNQLMDKSLYHSNHVEKKFTLIIFSNDSNKTNQTIVTEKIPNDGQKQQPKSNVFQVNVELVNETINNETDL